ncbi:hypothetical protein RIEGSTA812A_PEG_779 [invertebrate metagenome]|uniref:Uncharacterized protein n=1 Tax=invertebrate metagenome TaxID=1711999 RepID=A0A484H5K0_9ZZZZ
MRSFLEDELHFVITRCIAVSLPYKAHTHHRRQHHRMIL